MARKLQNWLRSYAEYTSISEAPPTFHFWTGVSVIAGALRRRVWIGQKKFKWVPNMYIILVAPPGIAAKSTSMSMGYSLLRKVPGIKFGPQSMTWQGLLRAFDEARVGIVDPKSGNAPDAPLAKRYIMSCLTCDVSELGTFLRPKDLEMNDFLTDVWDSKEGAWTRVLAGKDATTIESPCLNVMGCTTPSWLRENFSSGMVYGGLTSRCIFVWGESKTRLIAYPGDEVEDERFISMKDDLIHDLGEISTIFGEIKLTDKAKEWGREWYEKHWSIRPKHLSSDRFSGYIARKQTHIHKLAMILHAAESSELLLDKDKLELADLAISGVERDLVIVLNLVSDSDSAKNVDEVMTIIRRNKTIRRRQCCQRVWRHCLRRMDEQQFSAAINGAILAGFISSKNIGGHVQYSIKKEVEN